MIVSIYYLLAVLALCYQVVSALLCNIQWCKLILENSCHTRQCATSHGTVLR